MARRKARRRASGGSGGWIPMVALGLTLGLVVVFAGSAALSVFSPVIRSGGTRASEAEAKAPPAERSGLKVEIWNGSGASGAGQKVAEALRDGGFTVSEVKNADRSDYGTTLVVDRKGNARAAREVVESLHGGIALLMRSQDSPVDVRVIVGRDYQGLKLTP